MSADPKDKDRFARFKDAGEFVFAGVLVLYGVFGYYLLREQLDVMWLQTSITQNQIIDAERSERRARGDINSAYALNKAMADAMTNSIGPATTSAANAAQKQVVVMTTLVNANRAMASTAAKSVAAADRQFRIAQAPHVVFDGIGGHGQPQLVLEADKPLTVPLYFKNSGRSAAMITDVQICTSVIPLAAEVICAPQRMRMVWEPEGQEFISTKFDPVPQTAIDDISKSKRHLWLVYRFEYGDQFGEVGVAEGCQMLDGPIWIDCKPEVRVKPPTAKPSG